MVFDSIREAKAKGPFVPKFEVEDLPEDDFSKKTCKIISLTALHARFLGLHILYIFIVFISRYVFLTRLFSI